MVRTPVSIERQIYGKVKIIIVFKHHTIKTYGGEGIKIQLFLISALNGDEGLSSHSGSLSIVLTGREAGRNPKLVFPRQ
jgi:hypothetical protein